MVSKNNESSFLAEVHLVNETVQEDTTAVVVEQTHGGDDVLSRSERLEIQEA